MVEHVVGVVTVGQFVQVFEVVVKGVRRVGVSPGSFAGDTHLAAPREQIFDGSTFELVVGDVVDAVDFGRAHAVNAGGFGKSSDSTV